MPKGTELSLGNARERIYKKKTGGFKISSLNLERNYERDGDRLQMVELQTNPCKDFSFIPEHGTS